MLVRCSLSHLNSVKLYTHIPTENCLKLDHLERIVIDGSHIDQKKRSIFDMKEIFAPLLEFLTRPELMKRYTSQGKDRVDVLVF